MRPFAGGVVAQVQPFAQDLAGDTVAPHAQALAGNAVTGAQDVADDVTPSYVPAYTSDAPYTSYASYASHPSHAAHTSYPSHTG